MAKIHQKSHFLDTWEWPVDVGTFGDFKLVIFGVFNLIKINQKWSKLSSVMSEMSKMVLTDLSNLTNLIKVFNLL